MSDGYINIGTKIDETGLDKGLKNVDDKLKTTEKTTSSTAKSFASLGLKVAAVAGAVKVAADVINDLTDAYKTQIKAETQLESAAKNNPYLDSTSVQTLKNYASEIQSYSTFGDEELLPMMAKLAAAGRSQDEIMKIMSAATDMAASGSFSLDAAVSNLNKSYGGLSGELGESIPEIKNLSAEQLKNGAAVELLAGRYKGIAADVAKTTGTAEQLGNAFRDLEKELGAPFEKGMGPVRAFFTEIITGWANAAKAKREAQEGVEAVALGNADAANFQAALRAEEEKLKKLKIELETQKRILAVGDVGLSRMGLTEASQKAIVASIEKQVSAQNRIVDNLVITGDLKSKEEKDAKAIAEAEADTAARNKETSDYIAANTAAREKALQALKLQADTEGRAVTEEEKLSVYAQSYVDLVGNANGLVRAQDAVAKNLLKTTRDISAEAEKQNESREKAAGIESNLREMLSSIEAADPRKESEKMAAQLVVLKDYYTKVQQSKYTSDADKLKLQEEYLAKRKILLQKEQDAVNAELKDEKQDRLENAVEILSIANDFATQYANIMASISTLMTQQIEDEAAVKTAEAEKQYQDGTISAQEYEDKISEIKKDAAKEQYKVDMWLWSSNVLSSIANTALGVTQALSSSGNAIVNMLLAGMIGAAGAAQLATIIANKPIPPSFATGGIVGGTSYTGDRVKAMVNSGEMILNAGQQRNLFDGINSGNVGGRGDIKIYNSASNDVKATPQITEDGIKIMIEKTVSSQMADGRFNKSYRQMQNNLRGTRYTN